MFQFEIHLARYLIEMQKERQAKAEKEAEYKRMNQAEFTEDFLRNNDSQKSQISNTVKRSDR